MGQTKQSNYRTNSPLISRVVKVGKQLAASVSLQGVDREALEGAVGSQMFVKCRKTVFNTGKHKSPKGSTYLQNLLNRG